MKAALTITMACITGACASAPANGVLGDDPSRQPRLVVVDSTHPPRSVQVQMDQPGYVALVLVAPGHSATLLYPRDSLTSNHLNAGTHEIAFEIPSVIARPDSSFLRRPRARTDTNRAGSVSSRSRQRAASDNLMPLPPNTRTYLLLVTSPQPLSYGRMLDKTGGVSIPLDELEALNAVGKAIKSTIPTEPREWVGYFKEIQVRNQ